MGLLCNSKFWWLEGIIHHLWKFLCKIWAAVEPFRKMSSNRVFEGKKSRAGTWYPVSEIPLQIFCWHKILAKVCNLNAFYFMGVVRGGPHCRRGVKIFVKLMLQQLNLSCSSANFLHHHTQNDIVMQVDRPKKRKINWMGCKICTECTKQSKGGI